MPNNHKFTSPEQLNSYIRVTSPGAWIILASVLMFQIGFFIWIFFGELQNPADNTIVKPITFLLK